LPNDGVAGVAAGDGSHALARRENAAVFQARELFLQIDELLPVARQNSVQS